MNALACVASSVWPAPVFESHDDGTKWLHIGGPNTVAVGADCPFDAHGPTESLEICQDACVNDGSCNVVNWNPDIPDCVFRTCSDPLHPQLSPQVCGFRTTFFY